MDELGLTFEPCLVLVGADGKVVERLDTIFDSAEVSAALAGLVLTAPVTFGAVDLPAELHALRARAAPRTSTRARSCVRSSSPTSLGGSALHHHERSRRPPRRPLHPARRSMPTRWRSSARWPIGWRRPSGSSDGPSTGPPRRWASASAATGTGIAVHPTAVRERAATVARGPRGGGGGRGAAAHRRGRSRAGAGRGARPAPAGARPVAPNPVPVALDASTSRRRAGGGSARSPAASGRGGGHQRVHQPPPAGGRDHRRGVRRASAPRPLATTSCCCSRRSAIAPWRRSGWPSGRGATWPATTRWRTSRRWSAASIRSTRTRWRSRRRPSACAPCPRCWTAALAQWTEGWQSFGLRRAGGGARRRWARWSARSAGAVVLAGGAVERAEAIVKAAPAAPVLAVEAEARRRGLRPLAAERQLKDLPQPQLRCAFGLSMANPAPWRPSL